MTPIVLRRTVTVRYRLLCFVGAAVCAAAPCVIAVLHHADQPLSEIALGVCLLGGFLALSLLWTALFYPAQLWTIDEDAVTVRNTNVFGGHTRSWPMRDVVGVRVRANDGEEAPDTYYVELRLASGKRLRLPFCKGRGCGDEVAEQIDALRAGGPG